MEKKGTVTSLSSLFPAEETQKASMRVQDTINERQQQIDKLQGFIHDNTSLINLVHKLPHETHHDIMVPFGKAAFFPGRLIHTNEFMVLLGEGYYAERTSKQTTEILKRRGTGLETQVESLKAIMQDLKAEASFFDTTADESAEGLVEIREDYIEEESSVTLVTTGHEETDSTDDRKAAIEDDEYARIFARIAELEKEEEAEESDESDKEEQTQNELDRSISQISIDKEVTSSPVEASEAPAVSKDGSSRGNYPVALNSSMMNNNKDFELPVEKKVVQAPLKASSTPLPHPKMKEKENEVDIIGSIVEHGHNVGTNLPEQQSGVRTSKPVSRFKMQRK